MAFVNAKRDFSVPALCARGECRRDALSACARCKETPYCSTACQAEHWKLAHRLECYFSVWPPLEMRKPKGQLNGFQSDVPEFNFDAPLLQCARGGLWCRHRRLHCAKCPCDHRDPSLVAYFPAVPKADVEAWLAEQRRREEAAMVAAFDGLARDLRLFHHSARMPMPRSQFIMTIGGQEVLGPNVRSNALMDYVTEGMWQAPPSLVLR